MPFRASVLTLIGVLSVAAPAAAGDAKCLWDHLPGSVRGAFLLAGLKDDPPSPMDHFTSAQIGVALAACKVSDAGLTNAGHAFAGYTGQLVAERRLAILASVYPEQLDAAWASVDPAWIDGLAKEVQGGPDQGMGLKVWHALVDRLRPSASDASVLRLELVGYMSSRATRQVSEGLY